MVKEYAVGRSVIPIDTETGRLADGCNDNTSEEKKGMTGQQCMEVIEQLSHAQGFYSALFGDLKELENSDKDSFNTIMKAFEAEKFNDSVDLVLYLEA